ncbi:hypothetical protein UlMin_032041 [Ulmus minor]
MGEGWKEEENKGVKEEENLKGSEDHAGVEEDAEENPTRGDEVESEKSERTPMELLSSDVQNPVGIESATQAAEAIDDAKSLAGADAAGEPQSGGETANLDTNVDSEAPREKEDSMEVETVEGDNVKAEGKKEEVDTEMGFSSDRDVDEQVSKYAQFDAGHENGGKSLETEERLFLLEPDEGDESGTEEDQVAFAKQVENLYREKYLEWKPPKFYKEELNLLKLWRAVIKLGGYEQVTSCKLWRQVGESFKPPKTCTTVSWTFRNFYEKALLEFEKHKLHGSELILPVEPTRVENRAAVSPATGTGRALRDSAARAMQGWHSRRLLSNGEVGEPIIKDKNLSSLMKSDKHLKSTGLQKRKKPSSDLAVQVAHMKSMKSHVDMMVFDIGPPAEWVKVNVHRFSDCFEIYALVPGLIREEVHVQSDPAGRVIISGQPSQLDNPWGVKPFKKVVSLPSRIDPHQTSAVVTLNGQLFVRVPFEQPEL